MADDGTWYVLVEQDDWDGRRDAQHVYRWRLVAEYEARDEEHARARAKDLLRTHLPGSADRRRGARPHVRRIYELAERSWLVAIEEFEHLQHFRVSVARLVGTARVDPPPARRRRFG